MPSRHEVHFARNLLALVPKSHKDMVAAVFRTAFAQHDAEGASHAWDQVRDQLAGTFPNEASVIRLVGAVLNDAHHEWQVSDRRYLSNASMAKLLPAILVPSPQSESA
jgi:transposase-like protein